MNKTSFLFGISGSQIQIKDNCIVKTSNQIFRFQKQIEKQINFKNTSFFKTPKVISHTYHDNFLECKMEYIKGFDCINFFNLCDKSLLLNFTNNLINYIDTNLSESEFKFISKEVLHEKVSNINFDNKLKDKVINKINLNYLNSFLLPIGKCHGDFTFTNMIFQNNEVYLIDFLDSYIESPIQDILKLRQETSFFWSILEHKYKLKNNLNYSKIATSYKFIDDSINNHYKKYDWYNKNYNLLQAINLCRILPYVKIKEIELHLVDSILSILEDNK